MMRFNLNQKRNGLSVIDWDGVEHHTNWDAKLTIEHLQEELEGLSRPIVLLIMREEEKGSKSWTEEYKKKFNLVSEREDRIPREYDSWENTCDTFSQFPSMEEFEIFIHNVNLAHPSDLPAQRVLGCALCSECGKTVEEHLPQRSSAVSPEYNRKFY